MCCRLAAWSNPLLDRWPRTMRPPRVLTAAMTKNAAATGAAYLVLAELAGDRGIIEANR
jgi:hypothetical protein